MASEEKKRDIKHFFRLQLIRLHRLAEHPHDISLGVAFGVFISFTPLIGFHLILATVLCIIFGGSKVASWIGTIVGNPATFPIFYWADHKIGSWLMERFGMNTAPVDANLFNAENLSFQTLFQDFTHYLLPIGIGSIILGPLAAAIFYYATYAFVDMTRRRRQERMARARHYHLDRLKQYPLSEKVDLERHFEQP